MTAESSNALKIGDLAKQTGLSIRTLHYYDEIGLLKPSQKTEAGHRLYVSVDIMRLQHIVSLRQLGFSLDEIKDCLDNPQFSPVVVMQQRISQLREQIQLQRQLVRLLENISASLQVAGEVAVSDFMQAIEVTTMSEELFKKYSTPEQRQYLDQRQEMLGDAFTQEWQDVFAAVKAEMDQGTDPTDEKVLALAQRWYELGEQLTGGDSSILGTCKRSRFVLLAYLRSHSDNFNGLNRRYRLSITAKLSGNRSPPTQRQNITILSAPMMCYTSIASQLFAFAMLETIEKDPEEYGYEFGRWTAARLATYLEKVTGIKLSGSQIARILHKKKRLPLGKIQSRRQTKPDSQTSI